MKKYILGICAFFLLTLTSCYDLDQYPQDSANVDFNNETKAFEALVGVYNALGSGDAYNGFYSYESISDLGWSLNGWWSTYDKYNIHAGYANTYYGTYSGTWQAQYRIVQRANNVILNVKNSSLDESTKNQYIAEASFLRALGYFNLVTLYGGVPIYTDENTADLDPSEMKLPRNTADEVRAQILSDLDYAISNLPKTQNAVGRASQGAAYALRGKVYLYNKQYELAKADFLQVVNGGYGYDLHPDYAGLFIPTGYENGADDCEEIIFAVEYTGDTSVGFGLNMQCLGLRCSLGGGINWNMPTPELVAMYETKEGKPYNQDDFFPADIEAVDLWGSTFNSETNQVDTYTPYKEDILNMYEQRDPRMSASIVMPYSHFLGWVNDAAKDLEYVVWADGVDHNNATYGYVQHEFGHVYLWRKFVHEANWNGLITSRNNSPVNWPIIRYADVLLMLAETYCQTGDQANAVSYVNKVRQRVGMPGINSGPEWLAASSQSEVMERIKHERCVELACEGQRFFDLLRWGELYDTTYGMVDTGILGDVRGTTRWLDRNHVALWPIPGGEIDKNSALEQNPGW